MYSIHICIVVQMHVHVYVHCIGTADGMDIHVLCNASAACIYMSDKSLEGKLIKSSAVVIHQRELVVLKTTSNVNGHLGTVLPHSTAL